MSKHNPIVPPSTIGILGGGQLGRMITLEAKRMGYNVVVLDPTENSPCGQIADQQVLAPFDSMEGAKQLADKADVITYEFENIDATIASYLQEHSYLPQGYTLLYKTQNRIREKHAIQDAGVAVAPFVAVRTIEDLREGLTRLGYPAVLKTAEGGYDGKGQYVIRSEESVIEANTLLSSSAGECVLEQWIPYTKELSIIVARNANGETQTFPVAENIHQENILHVSIAPARVDKEILDKASQLATRLANAFGLVGLLAIELFLMEDGTLYVNELAPRPHNSGHYTQEACLTSQFEQHVRSVCNLPLAQPTIERPTVMVNILGEHLSPVIRQMPYLDESYKVHLYGKSEAKTKRKMGHINVVADNIEQAIQKIKKLDIWDMEGI